MIKTFPQKICFIAPLVFGIIASETTAAQTMRQKLPSTTSVAENRNQSAPLYAAEVRRSRAFVDQMIAEGVNVPIPKDAGGGVTHEQHKRNWRAIAEAGELYRTTGEMRYFEFVRSILLAYADLYPKLGPHPARSNQLYGRLFWQNLNDAMWLVNSIQGYEDIRANLNPADRMRIDNEVFRRAADFLSIESVSTFDRIHNHATWSTAGVGMTGYVLGDPDMVQRALLGSKKDGKSGFLRQMDVLLSPDGYYAEGPYYQRFALLPFMVFADAIDKNNPNAKIFERRNGVLIKAFFTTVQLTYNDHFMSFNDAMKDKTLNTAELYQGVAIAYSKTRNPEILSVANFQNRVALSEAGRIVAKDLASGLAKPFVYKSMLFSDGPNGDQGAVAVLRHGNSETGQAIVAKNSSQGMGHGHFDKLSWQFFDNGSEVITDYGAARFLNIEAKSGGRYLPENETWAKQTVAHNTLVTDQKSHFDFDEQLAESLSPRQMNFQTSEDFSISIGQMEGAYPAVKMIRSLASVRVPGLEHNVTIDVMRVASPNSHSYDLPLHFNGHLIRVGPNLKSYPELRPVLGNTNGYQHIWVDAEAAPTKDKAFITWKTANRFYTWRWIPQTGAKLIIGESGAGDPNFNLRREPMLIQRLESASNTTFVGVLESHGNYDGAAEQTTNGDSQIANLNHIAQEKSDIIVVETKNGKRIALALAHEFDGNIRHTAVIEGETIIWNGPAARVLLKNKEVQK